MLLTHRKAHLYPPAEPPVFRPGGVVASVAETRELGTVGLAVCFDGDFPETARALRLAGADAVLLPAAYESAAATWRDTLYPPPPPAFDRDSRCYSAANRDRTR